jgi:hypothetical protein
MEAPVQNQGQNVDLNPLASPITAQVETKLVSMEKVSFHFRKDKDLEKANPELVGKTKRPTFEWKFLNLLWPVFWLLCKRMISLPSWLLKLATTLSLTVLVELLAIRLRTIHLTKKRKKWNLTLKAEDFNLDDLSFLKIANLPKSERGAGIPKEVWAAFVADYIETMQKPAAIALFSDKKARTPEVLIKHGQILGGKFNPVRSRKDVIQQMLGIP